MQVIDNAVDQEYFDHLKKSVQHCICWTFQEQVATSKDDPDDEQFYFVKSLYHNLKVDDDFYYNLQPLFEALEIKAIIRCRIIMYVNQGKFIKHTPHTDYDSSHNAALLYMNTNNGYTGMVNDDWVRGDTSDSIFSDGNKVESVENRILLHDGSIPHYSTTCTDTRKRIVLAVNYY